MERPIFVLHEFVLLLSGMAILTILFVIIHKTLKQMSIFKGPTTVLVAICVSLLSVIGLSRFFVIADVACKTTENRRDISLDFILLPYTALALAIALVLLLLFIKRLSRNHRMNKSCKEISRKR
jgi:tellurite resistance protein TehA-like permease